jgi:adenylate kinase family enzyme
MRNERLQSFIDENDVYLFGPTGVGKTSFAVGLRAKADIGYVSIGEITKKKIDDGDEELLRLLQSTSPWSLGVTTRLVESSLAGESSQIVDGFPRRLDESEWLVDYRLRQNRKLGSVALILSAPDEIVWRRLLERNNRLEGREVFSSRLVQYRHNIVPVIKTLKRKMLDDIINIDTSELQQDEVVEQFISEVT